MSVSLLVTSKTDPEQRTLVPVAAQKIFTSRWLPGCEALSLEWVPLFETGIPVDASNADSIGSELAMLRQWMIEQPDYQYEVERISRLIQELDTVQSRDDLEIFVG
jgi:hypothetical protein